MHPVTQGPPGDARMLRCPLESSQVGLLAGARLPHESILGQGPEGRCAAWGLLGKEAAQAGMLRRGAPRHIRGQRTLTRPGSPPPAPGQEAAQDWAGFEQDAAGPCRLGPSLGQSHGALVPSVWKDLAEGQPVTGTAVPWPPRTREWRVRGGRLAPLDLQAPAVRLLCEAQPPPDPPHQHACLVSRTEGGLTVPATPTGSLPPTGTVTLR